MKNSQTNPNFPLYFLKIPSHLLPMKPIFSSTDAQNMQDASRNGPFTVARGLAIQKERLDQWEKKLNADCFLALSNYVASENEKLNKNSNGYDVVRGSTLDGFILNWKG